MPANVEIKARVPDMDALRRLAEEVADGPPTLLSQSDTFFRAEKGRLKLRVVNDRAELIFYDRPDGIEGPKLATFQHAAVSDADALRECLGMALETLGRVEKERWLYTVGDTRLHVDTVKGLGNFMELELNLSEGQTVEAGMKVVNDLMVRLKISPDNLCTVAYLDMLRAQEGTT